MRGAILSLTLALVLVGACGCYSTQKWGPVGPEKVDLLQEGETTEMEVLRSFGAPDASVDVGDQDVWIYRTFEGLNVAMIYMKADRRDVFVAFDDDGVVSEYHVSRTGEGTGIFSMLLPVPPAETAR